MNTGTHGLNVGNTLELEDEQAHVLPIRPL